MIVYADRFSRSIDMYPIAIADLTAASTANMLVDHYIPI